MPPAPARVRRVAASLGLGLFSGFVAAFLAALLRRQPPHRPGTGTPPADAAGS